MSKELNPYINIGPGKIIQRNMETLGWTNKDLAKVLSMSDKRVSLLIKDKQEITVHTAALLAKAFNSSPEFWLNLQQKYLMRTASEDNSNQLGNDGVIK